MVLGLLGISLGDRGPLLFPKAVLDAASLKACGCGWSLLLWWWRQAAQAAPPHLSPHSTHSQPQAKQLLMLALQPNELQDPFRLFSVKDQRDLMSSGIVLTGFTVIRDPMGEQVIVISLELKSFSAGTASKMRTF